MSRNIITKRMLLALADDKAAKEDPYVSKIIKLVPADIICVYLAVFNLIKNTDNPSGNMTLQWIAFILILIITPFYLNLVAKINTTKQNIFCTVSFVIWVFSTGGPVEGRLLFGYPVQLLATIILMIYTLLIPIVYKQNEIKK